MRVDRLVRNINGLQDVAQTLKERSIALNAIEQPIDTVADFSCGTLACVLVIVARRLAAMHITCGASFSYVRMRWLTWRMVTSSAWALSTDGYTSPMSLWSVIYMRAV